MKRAVRLARALLCGMAPFALAPAFALAHGGSYQPPPPPNPPPTRVPLNPGGTFPPGMTPTDPRGPLTGPGTGPITGPGREGDPPPPGPGKTPPGDGPGPVGPTTPGSGPLPTQPPPTPGTRPGRGSRSEEPGLDHWSRWWFPNRDHLLGLSARVPGTTTPGSADGPAGSEIWRAEVSAALVKALGDSDEEISTAAAIALGKGGDPSHTDALACVLLDGKRLQPVREAAALALGLVDLGDSEEGRMAARVALERVAGDRREAPRLRGMAVYGLGLRGDTGALPYLISAAHSPDVAWDVPAAGIASLGLVGEDLALPDLEDVLRSSQNRRREDLIRRVYAAQGLARLGDAAALPVLREAAADSDEDVRRAALLALGALANETDDDTAELLLRVLARDKDRACRNMAALSLARTTHPRAEAALRRAYTKGDRLHQPFAALALGLLARETNDPRVVSPLAHDLGNRSNADLLGALAVAVGLARFTDSSKELQAIVSDRGDPELRSHAAIALGLMGDTPGAAATLRSVLQSENDPAIRREAALALGLLGDREAVRILVKVLEDGGTTYEQGSAAAALGRIGGAEASKALLDLLRDERRPGVARGMAAVGLGLLLDRTEGRGISRVGADLNWYLTTDTVEEVLTIL